MATLDSHNKNPKFSSLEQRADAQAAHYWRVRTTTTLDRLEREARRMFHLESELSHFARDYYAAVGEAVERLAYLEQFAAHTLDSEVPHAMPAVLAQRDAHSTRQVELKARYRSLAKEIHPDRAMAVEGQGPQANNMHTLNAAYQHGDLAALLKLEAQMLLEQAGSDGVITMEFEKSLREVERAADTYAEGYRTMLGSPLNELMLRAMSARLAGWDWVQAVVRKVERAIEEKERAAIVEGIAQIGAWRETAHTADAA